jgi:hypothetical protein
MARAEPSSGSAHAQTPGRSDLLDCFYCLSVWVAVPFGLAISRRRGDVPLNCLALSRAACLLERLTPERSELVTGATPTAWW